MCCCRADIWAKVLTAIRGEVRTRGRRRATAAVVDSSSVKTSPVAGPREFDGATKVDAANRHALVDSGGILVAALLTPANAPDRTASPSKAAAPGQTHRRDPHARLG
jgi:hypothetical protein